MRILMLSWEYPPRIVGGISRVVYHLSQKLGEAGNEVHVVTCREQNTPAIEKDSNVYVHRVHTYDVKPGNFVDWVLHFNFTIIEHCIKMINETGKFDIIHAHDWIVAFAARVLKNAYFMPLACTIHATEYGRNWGIHNETQKYISNVEWFLTYESWKVIVNSNYMKEEVIRVFNLPWDKIELVPNGIDINKFAGIEKDMNFRRRYAHDSEKIIFYVGRIVNEKGVGVLLDSVPMVLSAYKGAKFIISGKGPQLDYLKTKASAMGVSQNIYFTGYISDEDLLRLYKCVDIAVFPSLYEPFGIVALEGMAAGVPIVVSDVGGLGEIVEHGVNGLKCIAGNANSLACSILEILFNPQKGEVMKNNALKKVRAHFTWDIISRQTQKVYQKILDERKRTNWVIKPIMSELP
ncbi:MAG TPA: glycosyltransferase family 4 protein [Clostridiaceae bacterium]|nr:glycosyltransferase family 4 protein [Clostridiaceae bacterium]